MPRGATPLDPDEIGGLIPSHISTQGELNEAEQANILKAHLWLSKKKKHKDVLTDTFIRNLHKRMFSDVWKWAGKFRTSGKNIGVPAHQISISIAELCRDTHYWIENKSYSMDEIGARFHHRLVLIHAFPNGNGRHARTMTDVLLKSYECQPFSWGTNTYKSELNMHGEARTFYLEALREADNKRFEKLLKFVRT